MVILMRIHAQGLENQAIPCPAMVSVALEQRTLEFFEKQRQTQSSEKIVGRSIEVASVGWADSTLSFMGNWLVLDEKEILTHCVAFQASVEYGRFEYANDAIVWLGIMKGISFTGAPILRSPLLVALAQCRAVKFLGTV